MKDDFSLLKMMCAHLCLSHQTNFCVRLILSVRVSRFVSDKEQSSVLISLLLPYLQKGHNPQVRLFFFIDLLKTVRIQRACKSSNNKVAL